MSESYDDCLERLLGYGPEYAGKLSNHGPMALEALLSLDQTDAFAGYVNQKSNGLLIHNLGAAAALPPVVDLMSQLAPSNDIETRFLELAEMACAAETANPDAGAFALLHGVTVPMVASTLLKYLDHAGRRHLEAAVVGFVVAAIVGFDESRAPVEPSQVHAGDEHDLLVSAARRAVETGDDHDIKYVEASTRLFAARPSPIPLTALARRFDLCSNDSDR